MIIVVCYWWMKWVASIAYRIIGSDKIYSAQSFGCFIILRERSMETNAVLIRHEKIHWRQQLELLIIGQWLLYLLFYFYFLIRFGSHEKAYLRNPFEREAYENEGVENYLLERRFLAWWKYL